MSETVKDEVINTISDGELLTLNQFTQILGGHPNTIKKLLEAYEKDGTVQTGEVTRKNRKFKAYRATNKLLAELQYLLKEIRKSSSPVKLSETLNVKQYSNDNSNKDFSLFGNGASEGAVQSLDNVKFYEVVKQNNELENKIKVLEAELQDKEIVHVREREKLNGERVQLQADNYKLQADIKLIEDKQKTFENAWAEEKQKAEMLAKTIQQRNLQLLVTGAVLLVVVVVITCYFVFGR